MSVFNVMNFSCSLKLVLTERLASRYTIFINTIIFIHLCDFSVQIFWGTVCFLLNVLNILKHKRNIIQLQIFGKRAKFTYLFL